jgi:class 3 adenylate cyclase
MSQHCTSCSSESPDAAKFCLECGTPFVRACPSCGQAPGGGKFCMECGTPLASGTAPSATAPPLAASAVPVSERRTTSVLFGDLVAFTTLSESRDPEEVRELLSEYFGVARTVVGRYGGTIEKFIGDAVMAVWGVPISREDDAERAVRAGIDLVAEVAALGEAVGAPGLSMRVGITTGSVAVTLGAVNEGMVAGDAVNTAARVQTAAEPGTVWVDQETRGLTAAAVAFSDMGEHSMKGKADPARLFRADAIVAAVGGAQRVDGLEAPMTGRDRELRQVKELFHETQADGKARVALVTGMAGVGKSRLGWEYEKYVDGITGGVSWHRGRCLSYGDGVAFWAFAEMIRSRLKLLEGDDHEEVDAKVAEGVVRFAADPAEAEWLKPRIAALLTPGGAVFDRTDLFAAWTTFLERIGNDGDPVVLLFEDTQHADSGLLDLIEHLLETCQARLFVLMLARPELLEQRPSLAAGRRATVIDLKPLNDELMTTLVDALVDDLPDRARAAIVGRAEGVPLYAVETVRSLIDRDAVVAREGSYVFVDHDNTLVDLDQLAAPTSLQMLIAARLDSLTAVERRTVQDASVLGLSFRQPGLMALSDVSSYDLDAALATLERKSVIQTQDDPRSPERGQYRFLQALVREVAYSTLARKDRRGRHLAAADHLESEGEDTAEALAGIIAQHLLDALEASSAHDPERPATAARARGSLLAAAERAEALGSPSEALSSVLSALSLEPEPLELAKLQEAGARLAGKAGDHAQGEQLGALAYSAYKASGDTAGAARVLRVQANAVMGQGRHTEGGQLAKAGLDLLDTDPEADPRLRIGLLRALTGAMRYDDDGREWQARLLEMVRLAEQVDDTELLVNALNGLAIMLVDAGCDTAYEALMVRCIELARADRLLEPLGRSLSNLLSDTYTQNLARAAELAAEALAVTRRVGDAYYVEGALVNATFTWWLSGDWDLLLRESSEWIAAHPTTSGTATLMLSAAQVTLARGETIDGRDDLPDSEDHLEQYAKDLVLGLCHDQSGDTAGAAKRIAAAVHACFGDGEVLEDLEVLWAPAVELQLQAGALDEAEKVLALATPRLGGRSRAITRGEYPRLRGMITAARGGDPEADFRAAEQAHEVYGALFLLARTRLELSRWLCGRGRTEEARPLLTQARETFVTLGATPSIADVDALVGVPSVASV